MKRLFQIVGIVTLLIGSFMYTDEVATTSKLSDELLNEIKEKSDLYKVSSKNAIIAGNTIIPGINGRKVDVKKSYEKMKKIGYFNEKLLVYRNVLTKVSIKNNKDKYVIGGNSEFKRVSILFKVDNDLDDIAFILDEENVKGTFFITSFFLEKNHNYVIKLLQEGHTMGNLSDNENYSDSDFLWMKAVLTSTKYQKYNYCYTEKPNNEILRICYIQNSYTIIPKTISNRPLSEIKNSLKNGDIIFLKVNDETKKELKSIINYIKARGYEIVSLENMLDERI